VIVLKVLFWGSAGALVWTHAGYPALAWLVSRLSSHPVRKGGALPTVTFVVAAHNEEAVIERRIENLLLLDYPPEQLEIVVASDASTDATDELVERVAARQPRVRLIRAPRGGKVAAQNVAVRETTGEILAFSDANSLWAAPALRKMVRNFADPEIAYVFGQHRYEAPDGTNRESAYMRFETWLRARESEIGSTTGGYGSIYAVRRSDYVEVDPRFGHDLALPYLMVQRGRRAVYEPEAIVFEKPSRDIEDEFRRKVRMFEHCWLIVLRGKMLRRLDPMYFVQIVSHRHLRYASGLLHVLLLATNIALVGEGLVYKIALALQLAFLAAAAARPGLPRYYVLISWATLLALLRYLRSGVPAVWEKAEGTR
jgi:cellulose synthase/poly-beta-1,6-N-acetylglucosamine synthase-like glycosyltransferase